MKRHEAKKEDMHKYLYTAPNGKSVKECYNADGDLKYVYVQSYNLNVDKIYEIKPEGPYEKWEAYEMARKECFGEISPRAGMSYARLLELAETFASQLMNYVHDDDTHLDNETLLDDLKEIISDHDMSREEQEYFGFNEVNQLREWTVLVKGIKCSRGSEWYLGKPFLSYHEYEITETEDLGEMLEDMEFSVTIEDGELCLDFRNIGYVDPDDIGSYIQDYVDDYGNKIHRMRMVIESRDPDFDLDEILEDYEYEIEEENNY